MSERKKKYGILACVDGSAASDAAIAWATREAVMRQLPITLMHAVPPVVVSCTQTRQSGRNKTDSK
jgi:nucleotide-binding universal stress UspA family protein